ncbi:MAG: hypothetical protein ACTSUE_20120 [Promethearchaeota archaeon]
MAILPGPLVTDALVLFLVPILVILLFIAIAPALVKGMFKMHSWLFKKTEYGVVTYQHDIKGTQIFKRALLVCLFSFSISTIIVEFTSFEIFRIPDVPEPWDDLILLMFKSEAIFLGTFLLVPLGLFVFVPMWILEDSGIVMYKTSSNQRKSPLIQGIHSLYLNIFKSYVGFSVIITLWNQSFKLLSSGVATGPGIVTPMILMFLPFIASGFVAIPTYIYEKRFKKMQDRIGDVINDLGLKYIKIPEIDEILSR